MRYLKDFLNLDKNSKIFEILECNDDEIAILRAMTKQYLTSQSSSSIYELLTSIYKNDLEFIEHIDEIKSLVDKGFITQLAFKELGKQKTSKLSMIYNEIELSELFLCILEDGSVENDMPQNTPYTDHLEYLKDQFLRVELYSKRADSTQNTKSNLDQKIQDLEQIINKRLKTSKIPLACEQIFKENALSQKEQIIFLALLKEEYNGDFVTMRDLNALIALVSKDDMEKIKNRNLLEDGANLIENSLVDYDEVINPFGNITRSFFINEDTLQLIMHPQNSKKSKKLKLETLAKESQIFELIEPSSDLGDVVLNDQTRELLDNILKQVDKKVLQRLASWGIKSRRNVDAKVIFYGSPGTGKTMSALSLAKSLKKQVLSFDCSKILSKYVGESEQNVRKIFDAYKDICAKTKSEPVLLLNEADQFLSTRVDPGFSSDKMHNQMQNIFLEQIEKFEGVLIATTNFMQSLDHAFSRRFDYKIEFKKPDFAARLKIWQKILPKTAKYGDDFSVEKLSKFELSGAQIVLALKNTAIKVAVSNDGIFTLEAFENEIKRELNSAFGEDKKVGLL